MKRFQSHSHPPLRLAGWAAIFLFSVSQPLMAAELPSLETIRQAVAANRGGINSYSFSVSKVKAIPSGSQEGWVSAGPGIEHVLKLLPNAAQTWNCVEQIAYTGIALRLDNVYDAFDQEHNKLDAPRSTSMVSAGGLRKLFFRHENPPACSILHEPPGAILTIDPVAQAIKPEFLDSPNVSPLRIEASDHGTVLVVLAKPIVTPDGSPSGWGWEYYLDADRGYILVRMRTVQASGAIGLDASITQVPHPEFGFVPSRVETNEATFQSGVRAMQITEVTSLILNPTLPPELFQIELPTGTQVDDFRTGQRYIVGEQSDADLWIENTLNSAQ